MHLGHLSDGQLHDLRASVEFEARRRALPPLSGHHLGQHPPSHTSLPAVHVPLSPHGAPPTPGTGGGMPPAEHGAPPTVSGKGPVQLPALPAPATGASIDHVVSIPDKSKASPNDSTSGAGQIDLDAELNHLQDRIHHLKRRNAATDSAQNSARQSSAPTTATVTGAAGAGATGPAKGGHHFHHVSHMEHLSEDPVSQQDLDAELSSLEGHLHNIKKHQATYAAQAHAAPPPVAPVEMPHWEHHKYGHHQITDPAWKPTASITDIYGHQHKADEFHYNTYGAGAHGHHLAHFHLNDYQGLDHHSFKPEEYHRQQYGAAGHHGHWVPHLHGIGTAGHSSHNYKPSELHSQRYGESGHHSHTVPHLHGLGTAGFHSTAS